MTTAASTVSAPPAADLVLSPAQINHFKQFGYLGFPGLLADRIEQITDAFEQVFKNKGGGHGGKPHDGKARSCIVPFLDSSEYLSSLLDDPRIHGILTSLLGPDFNYMGSDGNYYVGNTMWHSDSAWVPRRLHLKIAFYLDPVGKDSGCLRVIPGSHRVGEPYATAVHTGLANTRETWGCEPWEVPCVPLETKPGDIVLFNHDTKHAAFFGSTHRRMFTINCCERYPEEDLQTLRNYLSGFARFWVDRAYGEPLVRTATPQRMRHLEQVMANDGHLAALTAEAKKTMKEPSRG